jgi:tetratricopeptide (TPR) repeat protein
MRAILLETLFCGLLATTLPALADVASLAQSWDEVMYRHDPATREQALESLAKIAHAELAVSPNDAGLLIWYGIIVSSQAGEKGGLGALGLAKDARASLELAIERDPTALKGSAYTSLGTLYYKVPGWPIGFGNDKKAREYLDKALTLNPSGIDPNYFMGEFLFDHGDYAQSKTYLTTALAAPDRPDRPVGDDGRRGQIRVLLTKVDNKLNEDSAR